MAAGRAHAAPLPALVPPGDFVSLGTHRLYYHCTGEGSPTVVIDAGLGGSALEWTGVQASIAAFTRVCTYDRAGYGWSDPGPSPRTAGRAAEELRALLARAGERPPYVLVGHSFGGFDARLLAARYPRDVAALVLVESSHPAAQPAPAARSQGQVNAIDESRFAGPVPGTPGYVIAAHFLNSRRKALFAQMDELGHFADSAGEVTAAGTLPPLPLVVIARDAALGDDAAREARWRSLQLSLLALSPRGRFVVARGASHNVHLSRPDVIVDNVRTSVDAARTARKQVR